MTRVVLVLGYSPRRPNGLHPVCAARVEHATAVVGEGDVVVLSGTDGEVELMGGAWARAHVEPRRDPARRTADSAVAAVRLAEEIGADEVVVVTSWWHRPRAELMVRSELRRRGVRVTGSGARGPWSAFHIAREAVCYPLVPVHLALARRRAGYRRGRSASPPAR
jgi:hypothetical protein